MSLLLWLLLSGSGIHVDTSRWCWLAVAALFCIQEEPGPGVGGLRHGLQAQSSLYQKSTLGSHRPKPVSCVAQWLREASIVMHCLSENHWAAHCPHSGDNLLLPLAPQWAASSPAPTSQWAMSPYRHVAQLSNPQRVQ